LPAGTGEDVQGRIQVGERVGGEIGAFHDESRGEALFVVQDAGWTAPTADGFWRVQAIRLRDDGTFDPDGEVIITAMWADYAYPLVDEVEVVGEMKRVISFE